VSEERVRIEQESARYPVSIDARGRTRLGELYGDALQSGGLLTPGPWTETHEAVIAAADALLAAQKEARQKAREEMLRQEEEGDDRDPFEED